MRRTPPWWPRAGRSTWTWCASARTARACTSTSARWRSRPTTAKPLPTSCTATSPTASASRKPCACRRDATRSPWKRQATAIPTGICRPASITSRPACCRSAAMRPAAPSATGRNGCAGSRFTPRTGRSGNRRWPRISPAASRTSRWSCASWWAARCAGPRFTSSPRAMPRARRSAGPDRSATSPSTSAPKRRCASPKAATSGSWRRHRRASSTGT